MARGRQGRGNSLDLVRVPKTAELVAAELRRRIIAELREYIDTPVEVLV
ncbi:MAG: hypothetical protein OXH37_07000 [Gammaproteobacteria bacterium]|nr:hypothetical protein [Gammaproteobacteria bacterium]